VNRRLASLQGFAPGGARLNRNASGSLDPDPRDSGVLKAPIEPPAGAVDLETTLSVAGDDAPADVLESIELVAVGSENDALTRTQGTTAIPIEVGAAEEGNDTAPSSASGTSEAGGVAPSKVPAPIPWPPPSWPPAWGTWPESGATPRSREADGLGARPSPPPPHVTMPYPISSSATRGVVGTPCAPGCP
jgi:hypothetical protein